MIPIHNYRPDIDGLRAIAVMGVILFHANVSALPGGYLGVDVFFVISGYLITRILLDRNGPIGARLKDFYARRIRRLIPPAIPVVIGTFIVGYAVLSPDELIELTRSIVAYAVFVSNWFFMEGVGYFDGPAEDLPLLHTWSLSVEEQFYLLFPIIILLLKAKTISPRKLVAGLFSLVIVLSFAANIWALSDNQQNVAFYSSVTRFWEIAVGGLLATGVIVLPKRDGAKAVLGMLGLILISGAFLFGAATYGAPGWIALPAVIGTAMVIAAGGGPAARLLGSKPFVVVGLISYALYLWHWPIFVYMRFLFGDPTSLQYVAAIALTFTLSILSFFMLEKPTRFGRFKLSYRSAYGLLIGSVAIFSGIAFATQQQDGFSARFETSDYQAYKTYRAAQVTMWNREVRKDVCFIERRDEFKPMLERCLTIADDRQNVLVIGSSHAAHLLPGLSAVYADANISLLSVAACPPRMASLVRETGDKYKFEGACKAMLSWLETFDFDGFDAVILAGRYSTPLITKNVATTARRLASRAPVFVFGPVQHYRPSQRTIYSRFEADTDVASMNARFDVALLGRPEQANRELTELLNGSDVKFIDVLAVICPNGRCRHLDDNQYPVLIDSTHMSPEAMTWLFERLDEPFARLRPSRRARTGDDAAWAPNRAPIDESRVLWRDAELRGLVAQSGGTMDVKDRRAVFDLPKDGRLRLIRELPQTAPAGSTLVFKAVLTLDETRESDLDLIIQNGCEHAVRDGESWSVATTRTQTSIEERVTFETPVSCLQVRLWSRRSELPITGSLGDLELILVGPE